MVIVFCRLDLASSFESSVRIGPIQAANNIDII